MTPQPQPPAFTPKRTRPAATTWAELQAALKVLQPGDRLPCHGVVFPSEAVFAKRLSAPAEVVFDSACKANGGKGLHYPAIWFQNVAYLRFIFAGMEVTNPLVGAGVQFGGASHCVFDGLDVRNCATGAMGALPTNAPIIGNYIRATVRDWSLVPSLDNHAEKGTGLHGLLVETTQTLYNATGNTFVLTTPGSKMGGSLLEVGSGNTAQVPANNQAWLQASNLLQDAKVQTAGNALNAYGYINGLTVLAVIADGLHGFAVNSHPYSGGPYSVTVRDGSASRCCLNPRYAGQNPWQRNGGVLYSPGPFAPSP